MMSKRTQHLDLLRIIACLMVVMMHAPMPGGQGYGLFTSSLSYFTAPCIGLFFMVSGSLLLPIKTDIGGGFLKKRFSKVLFPTLFWSFFYLGCNSWMKGEDVDWFKALCSMPFSPQGSPVLWFMYTLMGLYLLAPILSRWLTAASRKELEFYLGLWGVSLCYPLLSLFAACNTGDTGILYYFTGYAGYFVLGYYLKKYPRRIPARLWLPLLGVAVAAPVTCKVYGWEIDFYSLFWYLSVFVAIQCVAWYQLIAKWGKRWKPKGAPARLLAQLSCLSFGIYLVHIFIMRYLLWEWEFIRAIPSYIGQSLLIAGLTFVLSAMVSYFISLLPKSDYVIGYKHKH